MFAGYVSIAPTYAPTHLYNHPTRPVHPHCASFPPLLAPRMSLSLPVPRTAYCARCRLCSSNIACSVLGPGSISPYTTPSLLVPVSCFVPPGSLSLLLCAQFAFRVHTIHTFTRSRSRSRTYHIAPSLLRAASCLVVTMWVVYISPDLDPPVVYQCTQCFLVCEP